MILCKRFESYGTKLMENNITNLEATQLIKGLYIEQDKDSINHQEKQNILQQAFEIYNKVEEKKNHLLINTILKLFLHLKQPQNVSKIWNDIEIWKQRRYDSESYISFALLMICCIKANNININKCIQILQWMKHCHVPLILHGSTISQLISKCNNKHHLKDLDCINSLIDENFIENDQNIYMKTALIAAYGRCQNLNKALDIFNSVNDRDRNIVCINAMMKAFANNKHEEDVLKIYNEFQSLNNNITHFLAIKACKNLKYFEKGKEIISKLDKNTLNIKFKTGLIDFYGTSSDIKSAMNVFDSIDESEKDAFCIGAMIKQYVQNNYNPEALELYDKYKTIQNNVCHLFAIKACAKIGDIWKGKEIHAKIKKDEYDLQLKNTLIHFYGQFQSIQGALSVFNSIDDKEKDSITYNSMIQAYIRCNLYEEALKLYDNIITKDGVSHTLALKACIYTKDTEKGKLIHQSLTQKLDESSKQAMQLRSSLIDFYGYFDITTAWNIFNSFVDENNKNERFVAAMMKACINSGHNKDALGLYDRFKGLLHDATIQMLAIKACTNLGDIERAKDIIHGDIIFGQSNDVDLKNTLIHFYGNAMDVYGALEIFNSIEDKKKDIITINAMMDAYCINDMNQECIELFKDISDINKLIIPDIVTYKIVVTACTFVASINNAIEIYSELKRNHMEMLKDTELQIKLINMNSKYGVLANCVEIFEFIKKEENEIYCTNIDIWNAMIRAYCINNDFDGGYRIYSMLKDMIDIEINESTYIILMNACSHLGEMEKAYNIWSNEIVDGMNDKKIKYDIGVINTMIDCFARCGYLNKSYEFIVKFEKNSKQKNDVIWNTLMSGCAKYNDKLIGQHVYNEMKKRFKAKSNSMTGAKISLSNIYATCSDFQYLSKVNNKT